MTTLYVTEYAFLDNSGGTPLPKGPPLAEQAIAIPGTSAAFSANTRVIQVSTDSVCSIKVGGQAPSATTSSHRMPANGVTELYAVVPGDKIAVVVNT